MGWIEFVNKKEEKRDAKRKRKEAQDKKCREETVVYIRHPETRNKMFIKRIDLLADITENSPPPPCGVEAASYVYIKVPGTNKKKWVHRNEINPNLGGRPEDFNEKGELTQPRPVETVARLRMQDRNTPQHIHPKSKHQQKEGPHRALQHHIPYTP